MFYNPPKRVLPDADQALQDTSLQVRGGINTFHSKTLTLPYSFLFFNFFLFWLNWPLDCCIPLLICVLSAILPEHKLLENKVRSFPWQYPQHPEHCLAHIRYSPNICSVSSSCRWENCKAASYGFQVTRPSKDRIVKNQGSLKSCLVFCLGSP